MQTMAHEQMQPTGGLVAPVGGRSRRRAGAAWWRFTRHLLEMVAAMIAGMVVLGLAVGLLGEPPGYANLLIQYAWMGVSMSLPMMVWMRRSGHTWVDGSEMAAAMLVPMFAVVLPLELGVAVPGLTAQSLLMLAHVAMLAGMAALMLYRWDRYSVGTHCH